MRSYKEYYKMGFGYYQDWYWANQDFDWWKYRPEMEDNLNIIGDYLESTYFLDPDVKCDASVIENHTNVRNSEWCILFNMIGRIVIDYHKENSLTDSYEYSCNIDIELNDDFSRTYKFDAGDQLSLFICDILDEFLSSHKNNIPNDLNYFKFYMDGIYHSVNYGYWTSASDAYMSLGYQGDDDRERYVECM